MLVKEGSAYDRWAMQIQAQAAGRSPTFIQWPSQNALAGG